MLHAYRLCYPDSPHAPPQLWEYAQPYIHHLLVNARTFDRQVVQRYFRDWEALASENARIWAMDYRPYPLYDAWPTWKAWLPEYRQLILEVQAISDAHQAVASSSPYDLHRAQIRKSDDLANDCATSWRNVVL